MSLPAGDLDVRVTIDAMAGRRRQSKSTAAKVARDGRRHHSVYVVYLRNPEGDGRAGYYVGMTGLAPEERLANHKAGIKAAGVVRRFGERLVPRLYAHLNPMTYEDAKEAEPRLAEELRHKGYLVYGGH
jgi:hypothetical protein